MLLALAAGCGGASGRPEVPGPEPDGGPPAPDDASTHVAPVSEELRASLRARMLEGLVGPGRAPLFAGAAFPGERMEPRDGGAMSLSVPGTPAEQLAALPYGPREGEPAALPAGTPLEDARALAAATLVEAFRCERLAALAPPEDLPPGCADAEGRRESALAELRARIAGLSFEPRPAVLGPAGMWQTPGLGVGPADASEGLPLLVRGPGDASHRLTVAAGVAPLESAAAPEAPSELKVRVDSERLLGRLAAELDLGQATVPLREATLANTRLAVHTSARGEAPAPWEAALAQTALGELTGLSPERRPELVSGSRVGSAAELCAGLSPGEAPVDVVAFLEVTSEYAGRGGPTRVWVSARGTLTLLDAYACSPLAEAAAEERALGLSEERAERSATERLLDRLLRSVLEAPDVAALRE